MLAEALGCSFIEADDYHSEANKGTRHGTTQLTPSRLRKLWPCAIFAISQLVLSRKASALNSCANPAKMSAGVPLSDADRAPWLESVRDAIRGRLDGGEDVAVSCSALRLGYRDVLRAADRAYEPGRYAACRVRFVCLRAPAEVLAERVLRRSVEGEHFMPASLLRSQLDLLRVDPAEGVAEADATARPDDIVRDTVALFRDELAVSSGVPA